MKILKFSVAAAAALTAVWCPAASAQQVNWPTRPVTVVVPYPAGGATDGIARLVAAQLQQQLGQSFVILNRGGAGGNIGASSVAKAPADGYTILFNINGHAIAPSIYKKLNYSPDDDFIRVTQIASTSTVLVVNPKVPAKGLQDLVKLAKAKPGDLNYGSTGVGNSLHLGMELLQLATGAKFTMVPFRGDAPLFQSLFRNDVQIALVPSSITKQHIESGAVRAIGITTLQRSQSMPKVPTLAEQGLAGFENRGWMGLFLPKGTPDAIVQKLYAETKKAIETDAMKKRFATFELEPVASSPAEFEKLYRADREKFARIIRDAKIPQQ
ncbi:MAG: Bug family tripartite tricarboxylate transporter substrate binding protein [Beijerinckiaceae bacterium]